jgi:hypothetical protein
MSLNRKKKKENFLRSAFFFGILHTDVAEQTTGPVLDCMTLEEETDRLSRNVCKEQPFYTV